MHANKCLINLTFLIAKLQKEITFNGLYNQLNLHDSLLPKNCAYFAINIQVAL